MKLTLSHVILAMLTKLKNYFVQGALEHDQLVFDRVKIYTLYSIIVFHVIVYILGSIPIFMGDYPLLQVLQIIGLTFIVLIAIALRRTKNYKIPGIIWMIGGVVYTLLASVVSQGDTSYLSYAVVILNVIISFLLLERGLLILNILFYTIYIICTLSIHFGYLPKLDFGLNLDREIDFLNQSNIFPIALIVFMISYIVKAYVNAHQKAVNTIDQQQKDAVDQQKQIASKSLTYKNSVDYAVQIQSSILTQSAKFESTFNGHFVFFKPKAKLSSNFYWVLEKDDLIYFALIDAIDGGVSGAIISIICQNGLRKAVQELNLVSPAAILEYLGSYIEKTLEKGNQKGGINVSLCTFNKEKNKLFYAGANCPIFILRNNDILEYSGDKQTIGKHFEATDFKNQEIKLTANDVIYLFTNGFAGQFGGENGEKLDHLAFKKILLSTFKSNLNQQKEFIAKAFDDWKGEYDQLDDVCLIGLKI